MSKKHKDLQPWLDYFQMLRHYEQNGLLQTEAEKHEAYVTQPALHAITPGNDPKQQVTSNAILSTLRRIRSYCAWQHVHAIGLSTYDPKTILNPNTQLPTVPMVLLQYEREPFALHVVENAKPNDPIYTLHISLCRRWWWPFWKLEHLEIISYINDYNNAKSLKA